MNRYRAYFDRVSLSPGQHRRMLEALDVRRRTQRRPKGLRYAALAACCALALFGGLGIRSQFSSPGAALAGTPGVALPPESLPPVSTPAPTPEPTADWDSTYSLVVEDPFDGQLHNDSNLPGLEITPLPTGGEMCIDGAAFPPERTMTGLRAEDMIRALGGEDEVPWVLYWAGFRLTGIAYFDGEEQLTRAIIQGEKDETTIALTLSPGVIPPTDVIYGKVAEQDYAGEGIPVKAFSIDMENGLYYYSAEFMSGDTGARFDVTTPDPELAASLVAYAVRAGALYQKFTTDGLVLRQEDIQHQTRDLTLGEAYASQLGPYLPRDIPDDFTAGSAYESRFWSWQDRTVPIRTILSVSWDWGYSYLRVNIGRYPAHYKVPAPDFQAGEITADALAAWGRYVDDDAGDVPGWRYPAFTVQLTDPEGDFILEAGFTIKGLTPQEAAAFVNSAAALTP